MGDVDRDPILSPIVTVEAPPDAPGLAQFGGGNDWVILTTAPNSIVGHLIAGRLNVDGIECRLEEFNPTPAAWLFPFGDPNALVRIYVRRSDLELGRELVLGSELNGPPLSVRTPVSVWIYLVTASVVGLLLALLEIFDFAPCRLAVFCF